MIREAFRNIMRRRLRSFLTVFGISIGITALTVMGSLSEFINRMVQVQLDDARGMVNVQAKFSFGPPGSGAIALEAQEKIRNIPEVKKVLPWVVTALGGLGGTEEQGTLSGLVGFPPEETAERFKKMELDSGSYLEAGDTNAILIGHALALKYNLNVGDTANFRGENFRVKGIFQPYEGLFINGSVIAPLDTVRRLAMLTPQAVQLTAVPKEGVDAEDLAQTISDQVADVKVLSPRATEQEARSHLLIFTAIVLGLAIISLVVGGVATINTMVMAISERTREIGLKKAVGAPDTTILLEYVTEASVMGVIAGLLGLVVGITATVFLNRLTDNQFGLEIFRVTARLSLFAVAFAVFLGAAAGFFPALRAARLNPVDALRTE